MKSSGTTGSTGSRLPLHAVLAALLTVITPASGKPLAASLEGGQPASLSASARFGDTQENPGGQQESQAQQKHPSPAESQAPKKVDAGPAPQKKESPYAGFWPSWFQMGISYRGRFEHPSGRLYMDEDGDGYYLNRVRLEAALKLGRFVDLFAMTQDARVAGYDILKTGLPGMTDALDLRQAYIDIHGKSGMGSLALRVGRQNLDFGSRRLIAVSTWGNATPVYDAAKLSFLGSGVSVDVFASTRITLVYPYSFNEPRKGENLYGSYVVLSKLVPNAQVEPYLFWRTQPLVRDELTDRGDSDLATAGLRFLGKLPHRFDYTAEAAFQRGTFAGDDVSAWAGTWGLGYLLKASRYKPKLLFEYNYATGDKRRGDGTRGTFDQLYPSNHAQYGIADQVGWRNTSNYKIGFEVEPTRRLKAQFDVNDFYLATLQDALYTDNGLPVLTNPNAGSKHVGWEPDVQVTYKLNRQNTVGLGYGRLNPGRFLKDSTAGHSYNYPYVYWECRY